MSVRARSICIAAMMSLAISSGSLAAGKQSQTAKAEKRSKAMRPAAASQSTRKSVRTLDAIRIEGEIAVPQVLFITSRDYRRYRDGLGAILRMSKLEVARSIDLPTGLRIVARPGQYKEAGK